MTDAFERHDAFSADGERYVATVGTFEATVTPAEEGYRVAVELPTIDAVAREAVAPVVVDGWYDTLRRRLTQVRGVTRGDVPTPTVERDGDTVRVETVVDGAAPAEDAQALVQFAEGTWFQGVVPGYEYEERVQAVRERAHERGSGG